MRGDAGSAVRTSAPHTGREAQPTVTAFVSSVEPADAEHIDGMIPEDGDSDTVDDRVMIIDISTNADEPMLTYVLLA